MPAQYEHIRDSEVARGKSYDEAQRIAAATYNKQHPRAPVTGHTDDQRAHARRAAILRQMDDGK